MKKPKYLLFILLISIFVNGQDKVYEFKIGEGRTLTNFTNSRNGYHFIKTGKQIVMAKFKDDALLCLDKDLNEVYKVNVNSNDFIGNPYFGDMTYVSNYGSYYNNIDQIISLNGEVKEYFGTVKQPIKGIEKQSGVNPIFNFFNENSYTLIGPDLGRKNYKKKYLDGDIKIFNLKNDDFSKSTNVLELPGFKGQDNTLEWLRGGIYEDVFYLWAFEEIEKDNIKEIVFYVAIYDYQGKLKSKLKLPMGNLSKRFISPAVTMINSGGSNLIGVFNEFFGFYFDSIKRTFLVSGFYSNSLKKNIKEHHGFYFSKYNADGKMILDKSFPFDEAKKVGSYDPSCMYFETAKEAYFRIIYEDLEYDFYVVDKVTGEMKSSFLNILKDYKLNKINSSKNEIKEFKSLVSSKKYKNKYFSFETLQAMLVNQKIEKYIAANNDKNNLYYNTKFLEDGGFIISEFNKNDRMIKLLKFN